MKEIHPRFWFSPFQMIQLKINSSSIRQCKLWEISLEHTRPGNCWNEKPGKKNWSKRRVSFHREDLYTMFPYNFYERCVCIGASHKWLRSLVSILIRRRLHSSRPLVDESVGLVLINNDQSPGHTSLKYPSISINSNKKKYISHDFVHDSMM